MRIYIVAMVYALDLYTPRGEQLVSRNFQQGDALRFDRTLRLYISFTSRFSRVRKIIDRAERDNIMKQSSSNRIFILQ